MPKKFSKLIYGFYALLLLVTATASCKTLITSATIQPVEIHKSPNDRRSYHSLELENGLRVMLISDPETDRAAAALDVSTGSSNDSKDRQGLAHFLEHMLFLGTDKYPEAGEYQRYISEHGGTHNAYTAFEHTNYFFDLDRRFLEPALDRFSQFFTAPLFNSEYVDREKHAVNSEYQSRLKDDGRREYDLLKTMVNPSHPFAKFSVGSLETLTDHPKQSLRDALLAFYRAHYSANRMTLSVLGRESIAELETLVRQKFSAISSKATRKPLVTEPLFLPQSLPLNLSMQPVNDIRSLVLHFPLPSVKQHYRTRPASYIGNLLGHEGEGSLLAYLKKRGWAEGLSAGVGLNFNDSASFQIAINLTAAGLASTDQVKQAVFAAIRLIRSSGIEKWRFDEQQQLAAINFKFQKQSSALHQVTRLANLMHDYPSNEVLRAPYLLEKFDPELITNLLDRLTPENMISLLVARNLKTDSTTPWFKAPYANRKLENSTLEKFRQNIIPGSLSLPMPNPFIPENLQIEPAPEGKQNGKPASTTIADGLTLWHRLDTSFNAPRADFWFTVRSPLAHNTAEQVALTALYVMAVNDQLNEFSYPAALAGLSYRLYSHVRGISVRVSGYSDKQPQLLKEILRSLKTPKIDVERFAIHKDELIRSYDNSSNDRPYGQALSWLTKLLVQNRWDEHTLKEQLLKIGPQDLRSFIPKFLKKIEVVAMANGNLRQDQAKTLTLLLRENLLKNASSTQVEHARVAQLNRPDWLYQFPVKHPDSALAHYIQGKNSSIEQKALFSLFSQILSTPYYNQLRTEKQLGYIVFATEIMLQQVPGIAFTVQSPNTDALKILEYTQEFLHAFATSVAAMDEDEFSRHKSALISKILEKDTALSQRSARYWREIDRQNFEFDTREKLAASIHSYPLEEFKIDYRRFILEESRNSLTIMAVGENLPLKTGQTAAFNLLDNKASLHEAR